MSAIAGKADMTQTGRQAFLIMSFTVPILAAETFYVIFDNTLKGCTVVTAEPSDKVRFKVLGTYKSEAEAEKAMPSLQEC